MCVQSAEVAGFVSRVRGAILVVVGISDVAVTPKSPSRILPLDLRKNGLYVFDSGGLAISERTGDLGLTIIIS